MGFECVTASTRRCRQTRPPCRGHCYIRYFSFKKKLKIRQRLKVMLYLLYCSSTVNLNSDLHIVVHHSHWIGFTHASSLRCHHDRRRPSEVNPCKWVAGLSSLVPLRCSLIPFSKALPENPFPQHNPKLAKFEWLCRALPGKLRIERAFYPIPRTLRLSNSQ